jgi:hypothetical protein
MDDNG